MNSKLRLMMTVFFVSFLLFISWVIFEQPISKLTRAKEEYLLSTKDSIIIAHPLTVKADGVDQCQINVFIRSLTGRPVSNSTVILETSLGNVSPSSVITDKEGKALFYLTSGEPGIASIEAKVGNQSLDSKISIYFE